MPTPDVFYDDVHTLRVFDNDGEVYVEVEHPSGCPTRTFGGPGEILTFTDWDCMTATYFDGHDPRDFAREEKLAPGTYKIKAWSTPPYWAGAHPVDADMGVEVLKR